LSEKRAEGQQCGHTPVIVERIRCECGGEKPARFQRSYSGVGRLLAKMVCKDGQQAATHGQPRRSSFLVNRARPPFNDPVWWMPLPLLKIVSPWY